MFCSNFNTFPHFREEKERFSTKSWRSREEREYHYKNPRKQKEKEKCFQKISQIKRRRDMKIHWSSLKEKTKSHLSSRISRSQDSCQCLHASYVRDNTHHGCGHQGCMRHGIHVHRGCMHPECMHYGCRHLGCVLDHKDGQFLRAMECLSTGHHWHRGFFGGSDTVGPLPLNVFWGPNHCF